MLFGDTPVEKAQDLLAVGRAREAIDLLQTYLHEGHGGLAARLLLARALMAAGCKDDAVSCAYVATLLQPDAPEAALLSGEILAWADRLPEAIAAFQQTLRLAPDSNAARFGLGSAWLEAGEGRLALEQFAHCTPETPGLDQARAQAEALLHLPRSNAKYVRHLFDDFSAHYDSHMLTRLQYRAPTALRGLFDLLAADRDGLDILDLGCGTGLSGLAFQDLAARLIGIDLSPRMIEAANGRGIYDDCILADIEEPPVEDDSFDLVLAADTLVYIGDLSAVMAAARRALRPDGLFLFSVEKKEQGGFDLGPKRRWRHSEAYLRAVADENGFDLAGLLACVPRTESNVDVPGFAVALQKKARRP